MKKSERNIVIAAVIIVCILGAWFGGFLTQYGFPPPSFSAGQQPKPTWTDTDKENYDKGVGRWNVYETVADSLDPATIKTSGTHYKLYWYSRRGTTWVYHETGNNKYVTLTPEDGGYLWVCFEGGLSGQAFYIDYAKILATNSYIENYEYTDVTGDGIKDFCFKYNMKGHAVPNSGYPSITFLGFLLTYDASFTGLNDLANATGIGTSTVTKYYDYYLSFSAAKKGVAIWKVEVKITSTDETKVRLKKLNIPGIGYLDGSMFDKLYTATDYRYVYTVSKSFDGALCLKYASNTQNRFDMTLGLEYTLVHPDDILITTTVYYLVAPTEAGATVSDSFYAQE